MVETVLPARTAILMLSLVSKLPAAQPSSYERAPNATCHVKTDRHEIPCTIFRQTEPEINYSYSVMAMRRTPVQTMTLSSGQVFNYVNATHEYHQEDIDSWFRLRSDSYDGTSYHWEILGWNNTSRDYPSHLKLSYLPVTDLGHPALHKIIELNSECSGKKAQQCKNLNESDVVFKPYPANMYIELAVFSRELPLLNVELLSGSCNITCDGSVNNCSISVPRRIQMIPGNKTLIDNLDPSYYCVKISLTRNTCCRPIAIKAIHLTKDSFENETVKINEDWNLYTYVILSAVLLSIIIFICVVRMHLREKAKKRGHLSQEGQEAAQEGLMEMNELGDEGLPNTGNDLSPSAEVLLLYIRESDEFIKLMEEFRKILTACGIKVWDPFDEANIELVSANQNAWIEDKLQKEEIRIILIETTSGVAKQKAMINRKDESLIQHYLDRVFIYALSYLLFNPMLCRNYKRLFVVRFGFTPHNEQYASTVSFARYQIPDNITSLITDIIGCGNCGSKPRQIFTDTNYFRTCVDEYVTNTFVQIN